MTTMPELYISGIFFNTYLSSKIPGSPFDLSGSPFFTFPAFFTVSIFVPKKRNAHNEYNK